MVLLNIVPIVNAFIMIKKRDRRIRVRKKNFKNDILLIITTGIAFYIQLMLALFCEALSTSVHRLFTHELLPFSCGVSTKLFAFTVFHEAVKLQCETVSAHLDH